LVDVRDKDITEMFNTMPQRINALSIDREL